MSVCVFVCVSVCMSVYVYVCISVWLCDYQCNYLFVFVSTCVFRAFATCSHVFFVFTCAFVCLNVLSCEQKTCV